MSEESQRCLEIIYDRIWDETNLFEEKEAGSPFLPHYTDDMSKLFRSYCVDIEKLLTITPPEHYVDEKIVPYAYHINYMAIPTDALHIASIGKPSRLKTGGRITSPKESISEILLSLEDYAVRGIDALIPRPSPSTPIPLQVNYPFLVLVYIGGALYRRDESSSRLRDQNFDFHVSLFASERDSNATEMTELRNALDRAPQDAYVSLHYTSIHAEPAAPEALAVRIERVVSDLQAGEPIAQSEATKLTFEAATLHFQRQWGDREATLKAQAKARGMIAHNLVRNLNAALDNLRLAKSLLGNEDSNSSMRFAISAAQESVRSGFAAPWLERAVYKAAELTDIWRPSAPPSEHNLQKLFGLFDRKLLIECNSFPKRQDLVKLSRNHLIGGRTFGDPMVVWLGGETIHSSLLQNESGDSGDLWPLVEGHKGSTIDLEGRRALLFSAHTEAIRNAIHIAALLGNDRNEIGIEINIGVAEDGSRINGIVRNPVPQNHALGDAGCQELKDKLESMSLGLSAAIVEKDGFVEISWFINFI